MIIANSFFFLLHRKVSWGADKAHVVFTKDNSQKKKTNSRYLLTERREREIEREVEKIKLLLCLTQ